LPWIGPRLHLGTWNSLNAKLHRWRKANEKPCLIGQDSSLTP